MRPVLSPDGKWLVFATRYKTDTGLRIRNLETGAERWLASPVTRDDQESRASRDTLPRYDFMPDGQSIVVPVVGKLQRIDVATGAATPIPFTARVQAEVAPRAYTAVRIDDGPRCGRGSSAGRALSPDGTRLVFSALNHLYVWTTRGGTPRRLTTADEGEFMPAWSPDGQAVVYTTWTTRAATSSACLPRAARAQTLTAHEGYYLDPVVHARRHARGVPRRRGRPTSSTRSCSTRRRRTTTGPTATAWPRSAASTRRTRSRSAGCPLPAAPDAGGVGARGARAAVHPRRQRARVFPHHRGLASVTHAGPRPPHARARAGRRARATTRRRPTRFASRPTARACSSACRASITSFSLPRAGRETVEVRIQGRGDTTAVPVKRMSAEGGDYLEWTRDGTAVTWALGAQFFRQAVDAAEPQKTDVVVDGAARAADRLGAAHGRARHHDERRRGDRERRHPRHRQPHRRGRARAARCRPPPASAASTCAARR